MKIEISPAQIEDTTGIVALDTVAPTDPSRAEHIKEWVLTGDCHVARAESKLVGYAVLNYHFFRMGCVEMLMINPASRRCGVGTALLRHLALICRTSKLWVTTNQSNTPMQKLLHKEGFVPSGVIENMDEGDPELVFVKAVVGCAGDK